MKNLNARERNFLNSLILECLIEKKKKVVSELEEIHSQKKKSPRETHLKEERRLLNGILSKIIQ